MILYHSRQLATPFDHYYKQNPIFYIHSINYVYDLYYKPHTSFNE